MVEEGELSFVNGISDREAMFPARTSPNRALILIIAALLVITLSQHALSLAGIPSYYQRVVSRSLPEVKSQEQVRMSNELVAAEAAARGMDLRTYAIYTIALTLVSTLVFFGVAALILWKAQGDWFRWFTAFILFFVPGGSLFTFTVASQIGFRYVSAGSVLWPLFLLYLYLFPNGKAEPRWTRWPMGAIAVVHLLVQAAFLYPGALPPAVLASFPNIASLVVFAGFPLILFSQVYRYLRISNRVERAQTKWVLAGLALIVLSLLVLPLVTGNLDVMDDTEGYLGDLDSLLLLLIPITIGISVLRYRLFDIDVILRKTLIYAVLTGLLALVYFGGVTLLQSLLSAVSQQQSAIGIVISTLAIAALFNPLRKRVQELIDRRFYRKKYEAERILASFAAYARDELDIERLARALMGAVEESMQPESLSISLKGGFGR
jgi:hypothetical protein